VHLRAESLRRQPQLPSTPAHVITRTGQGEAGAPVGRGGRCRLGAQGAGCSTPQSTTVIDRR
jgi:hypothetical protein